MKVTYFLIVAGVMALVPVTRAVDRVVTTDASTGAGSLQAAINALNDGDRITFNIPPAAGEVHWIQVPPDGWPLITKNNITIDGYTQFGASPNTHGIHEANNAVLKIVLTATNGNALSMNHAVTNYAGFDYPNLGFENNNQEQAILGFFKATNAWVKGFCIQAVPHTATSQSPDPSNNDCKAICFAPDALDISSNSCQGFHVSGCWFGLDPVTGQVATDPVSQAVLTPHMCVAAYGTGTNGTPGFYTNNITAYPTGSMGVAPRSTNPRAEFNVCITPYGFDAQGGPMNVSGNFWGILPDGVTSADMSDLGFGLETSDAYCEWGNAFNIVIGTDGDGVNDADEGNIFGKYDDDDALIEFYGSQGSRVIAGNTFDADIHGKSFGPLQTAPNLIITHINKDSTSTVRFGSDFNGVSDALEGNLAADIQLFSWDTGSKTNSHWLSMRGNSLTNTTDTSGNGPANRPPIGDGQTVSDGMDTYTNFVDVSGGGSTLDIIPVIGGTTTTTSLSGTCGKPLGAPYTNLIVDIYLADPNPAHPPQGLTWKGTFTDNSASDSNPAVGAFTFDTTALGLAHGAKVTIAVTYTSDTPSTIGSVARAGTQSTVKISNPGNSTYGIQKSASVKPTAWSSAGATVGGTATFTDTANPNSFYRAQGPTATGQTSPFSNVYTIP